MLTEKENKRISKFLSYVLRHNPGMISIELDANGWTDVENLIRCAHANGVEFDFDILKHVVETNSKKRFSFNDTFDKIRASQGHSIEVELGYKPLKPPPVLYHGTGINSVDLILKNGLEKKGRHHVHLSSDIQTAINVGQRHGKPVVLKILSAQMHEDAFEFYLSDNGVWLTDCVPAKYLSTL